jgi:hypothetical protein
VLCSVTITVLPNAVLLRNTQSAVAFGQVVAGLAVDMAEEIRDNSRIARDMCMIGMIETVDWTVENEIADFKSAIYGKLSVDR